MGRDTWKQWGGAVALGLLMPASAAAGTMDRLKGVSEHARQRVEGGPDHLWMGVGIFAALAVVVGLAAWWSLSRGKR